MKTRVVKNWKTSLLGLALLILSTMMLYLKVITGGEMIALLPTIVGLLCAPDSLLKGNRVTR
jgi:hypothetical protein